MANWVKWYLLHLCFVLKNILVLIMHHALPSTFFLFEKKSVFDIFEVNGDTTEEVYIVSKGIYIEPISTKALALLVYNT